MNKTAKLHAIALAAALVLLIMQTTSVSAQTPVPNDPQPTPAPRPQPQPTTQSTPVSIIHKVLFPADTLSNYLEHSVQVMTSRSIEEIADSKNAMIETLNSVLVGEKPNYAEIAKRSWPLAGTLAVIFFIFRVVLYNWAKLANENDSISSVLADILAASAFAVLSGELVDLVNRFLFLAIPLIVGDIPRLVDYLVDFNVAGVVARTAVSAIIGLGVSIGLMISVAAFVFGMLAAMIGFYVLSALLPILTIVSVLPQTRWLKALAVKYIVLISLLPLLGGLVIRSYAELSRSFALGGGIIENLLRLFWSLGASGLMLSLTGILGKLTIGQTVDAGKKAVGAVGTVAALASGVGALAAPAAASMAMPASGASAISLSSSASTATGTAAGMSAVSGAVNAGTVPTGLPPAPTSLSHYQARAAAYNSLENASRYTQKAATANLFGFRSLGNLYAARARQEEINSRKYLLENQIAHYQRSAGIDQYQSEAANQIPDINPSITAPTYARYQGPNPNNYLPVLSDIVNNLRFNGIDVRQIESLMSRDSYRFNRFMGYALQNPNPDTDTYREAASRAGYSELVDLFTLGSNLNNNANQP